VDTNLIVEKIKLDSSCVALYGRLKSFPYSFFLDSALVSEEISRFSFLGIEPFLVFKSKKGRITLDWMTGRDVKYGNPFFVLKNLLKQFKIDLREKLPFPFIGGGVGYFSYDLKDFTERLPDFAEDDIKIPDCIFCFYDTILAFDHLSREWHIASSGFPEKGKKRLNRQKSRLESLKNRLCRPRRSANGSLQTYAVCKGGSEGGSEELEANFTRDAYMEAVLKAKEYIKKGDIYQVNLSQRFRVTLNSDPFDLYSILRDINPAPFACFLNFGDVKIASTSPERFLKIEGRRIETRPIKGTRPRGKNPAEDKKLKEELIKSAKDRAENLMIIDLERNDLGRISLYGTVHVKEFMACEEYANVFHLVSTVEGVLRKEVDAMDCLINCFPGGSITGAPKIRSMEIIEELEPVKRSVYTGSVGYIGFNGDMDTSIVIRSFIIKGKEAFFQVGGGIVHDSLPEQEYQETLDKARALIEAVSHENSISKQEIHSAG